MRRGAFTFFNDDGGYSHRGDPVSNPEAAKARVAELSKAIAELREAVESSKTERASSDVAKAEHQKALDKATAEHAAKLSKDRSEFDAECARRKSELDSRADQLSQLQAKAQADADVAEAIRVDLEKRLAHLKAAAA